MHTSTTNYLHITQYVHSFMQLFFYRFKDTDTKKQQYYPTIKSFNQHSHLIQEQYTKSENDMKNVNIKKIFIIIRFIFNMLTYRNHIFTPVKRRQKL